MLAEDKGEPWGIVRRMLGCSAMRWRTEMVERGFLAIRCTMMKPRIQGQIYSDPNLRLFARHAVDVYQVQPGILFLCW